MTAPEKLKLSESDVLFSVEIANQKSFIYILAEHQSKPDKLMPFRLFKYMLSIWDMVIKEKGEKNCLPFPVIYPLVFYTGSRKYNGKKTLWELCGENAPTMKIILQSPFNLVDTTTLPESILTSHLWAGTMGFIMRNHFKTHFVQDILKIIDNLNTLWINENEQYVLQLIRYMLTIDDEHRDVSEFIQIIHDKLSPDLEQEIMTLAERIEQKGIMKEKIATVKRMLAENSELPFIVRATGLSLEEIKKIAKK